MFARPLTVVRRMGAGVDALSEAWIGWSFPPPSRAMDDALWSPDRPMYYCGQCGDAVGEGEVTDDGCGTCREGAELSGGIGDGVVRLGSYAGAMRHWVGAIKFNGWDEMAEALGMMLGHAVAARFAAQEKSLDRALIVPMPMPWQRRMYRGVDHAAAIAQAVGRAMRLPVFGVLARANHPPQVSMTPSDRKRSGGRGLRVRKRIDWRGVRNGGDAWPLEGLDVVLVDDVRTTGATLKAAVRLMRTLQPASVTCAVLAVSDSAARRARQAEPPSAVEMARAGKM